MTESVTIDLGGGGNDSIVVMFWYLDTKIRDVASVTLLSRWIILSRSFSLVPWN